MCISFEKISGKKNEGNVRELKGYLATALDAKMPVAIVRLPVELLEIDTRYQTEARTERDLRYLTAHWSEQKLLPLIGVPHWEEGKVYLVDGYGRWVGSQIVDKEKYSKLMVQVILNAPTVKSERLRYEAELYAYQNKQVAKMTPVQKHGAMIVLHDKATETLEKLKGKYGFEYVANKGNREASVLGSYSATLDLCKIDNGKAAEYVFDILTRAGFDRKTNGYASYIMRGLRDIYKLYSRNRKETAKLFINILRETTPIQIRSYGVSKYPMLDIKTAISLYLEDLVVERLGLKQSREVIGTRVVTIADIRKETA